MILGARIKIDKSSKKYHYDNYIVLRIIRIMLLIANKIYKKLLVRILVDIASSVLDYY